MVRVIEIGHIVAGPTAGLILADLGHDVIKIEKPGEGDISRRLTGTSTGSFRFFNRNKRSLTLNFNSDEGREIFLKLIVESDVLIDNLGSGALKRSGLSYEILSKINPGLIYLSLKGYGKGPYEDRKSLDYPIEVHTGLAYMTGLENQPLRVGTSIVDITSAMFGVIGILSALYERDTSGKGKYIDIGMFETSAFLIGQHIVTYQINHKPIKPINVEGFSWAIYDFFKTRDAKDIFIGVTTDNQWVKFCEGLKLGVCDDPKFEKNEDRYAKRPELLKIIEKRISEIDYADLEKLLSELNVAYSVLNTPWDLLNDIHLKPKMAEENFEGGKIFMPTIPNGSAFHKEPPELGEDDEEILRELGYSDEKIENLKNNKII